MKMSPFSLEESRLYKGIMQFLTHKTNLKENKEERGVGSTIRGPQEVLKDLNAVCKFITERERCSSPLQEIIDKVNDSPPTSEYVDLMRRIAEVKLDGLSTFGKDTNHKRMATYQKEQEIFKTMNLLSNRQLKKKKKMIREARRSKYTPQYDGIFQIPQDFSSISLSLKKLIDMLPSMVGGTTGSLDKVSFILEKFFTLIGVELPKTVKDFIAQTLQGFNEIIDKACDMTLDVISFLTLLAIYIKEGKDSLFFKVMSIVVIAVTLIRKRTNIMNVMYRMWTGTEYSPEWDDLKFEMIADGLSSLLLLGSKLTDKRTVHLAFLERLKGFATMKRDVMEIMRSLVAVTQNVYEEVFAGKWGLPSFHSVHSGVSELDEWATETMDLHNDIAKNAIAMDKALCDRLVKLEVRGIALAGRLNGIATLKHHVIKIHPILSCLTRDRQLLTSQGLYVRGSRMESLGMMIRGLSGVGKSTVVKPFTFELGARVLKDEELEQLKREPESCVYNRTPETIFWDGYAYQWACHIGDFGQAKDIAGSPDNEYMNWIRMINSDDYLLHCADILLKGSMYFRSKFVIATTNHSWFDPKSIISPDAINRRCDIDVTSTIKREYATDETARKVYYQRKLDVNKLSSLAMDRHIYQFHCNKTGRIYSYDELLDHATVLYRRKEEMCEVRSGEVMSAVKRGLASREAERIRNLPKGKVEELKPQYDFTSIFRKAVKANPIDTILSGLLNTKESVTIHNTQPSYDEIFHSHEAIKKAFQMRRYLDRPSEQSLPFEIDGPFHGRQLSQDVYAPLADLCVEANIVGTLGFKQFLEFLMADQVFCFNLVFSQRLDRKAPGTMILRHEAVFIVRNIYENQCKLSLGIAAYVSAKDYLRMFEDLTLSVAHSAAEGLVRLYTHLPMLKTLEPFFVFVFKAGRLGWTLAKKYGAIPALIFGAIKMLFALWRFIKVIFNIADAPETDEEAPVTGLKCQWDLTQMCQNVLDKVYSNLYNFQNQNGEAAGFFLFVESRIALMPAHYISRVIRETPEGSVSQTFRTSEPELTLGLDPTTWEILVQDNENDFALVFIPEAITHKKITQHFCTGKEFLEQKRRGNALMMRPKGKFVGLIPAKFRLVGPVKYDDSIGNSYAVSTAVEYDVATKNGDCGLPLMCIDEKLGNAKIFAIHVAGKPGSAIATFVHDKMFKPKAQFSSDGLHTMRVVRKLDKGPSLPMASSIRKSPLYGAWGQSLKAPAKVAPFVTEEGERVEPMTNAILSYDVPLEPPEREKMKPIVDFVLSHLANNSDFSNLRKLSPEEAAEGVLGMEFVEKVPRNTSMGYPHNTISRPSYPGKTWLWGFDEKYDFSRPQWKELRAQVIDDISKLEQGIRVEELYTDFPKDETVSIEKSRLGKTRLVSGAPVKLTIKMNMYFKDLMSRIMTGRIKNGTCAGINPYSSEWHQLAKRLTRFNGKSTKILFGDYKGFDKNQFAVLLELIGEGLSRFYVDQSPEDRKVREMLWKEIYNSFHVFGRTVIEWIKSLPSGNPFTTLINCIYGLVLVSWNWVDGHDGDYSCLRTMFDHLEVQDYGDDLLTAMDDYGFEIFGGTKYRDLLAKKGLIFTTASKKEGDEEFIKHIDEVTFLKRGFRFDEEMCRYLAPLEIATIMEMPYWTKAGPQREEIPRTNVDFALRELSLHDEATFNKYSREILVASAERLGYFPPITDYHVLKREVSGLKYAW